MASSSTNRIGPLADRHIPKRAWRAKNSALDVERWALGVIRNRESEGCLVALAVFKTVVATQVAR
jgi:hypothetical protein